MLARVVENVYWLSRYLERAENTARLVSVNTHLLLDLPAGYSPGWQTLIDITGSRDLFDSRGKRADEREVVQFLIAEPANPASIASSLKMAHENARTLRDMFPTEAWELLNQFFQDFSAELPTGLSKRTRFNFLKRIVLTSQTLTGALEGTMNRNDGYTFLMLGRNLERADMTSRIVDVRAAQLLADASLDLKPFETIQWMSVLRSLSGYEMYRLSRRTRVSRTDVLEFVLRGEQFPRACLFCLKQVEQCLLALPRSAGVLDALAGVNAFLQEADLASRDQQGLHELIDRLQLYISGVHSGIAQTYFPARSGGVTQRQVQRMDPAATLPLFADAPGS
ncbi:MAG TPA: alpha-E domain-containing protein [Steroidobacteraceae bacterium]|nr:alpha-E domain-containing protein [Steroidobacteraceae bacterium]